jgi:hypothetical protein
MARIEVAIPALTVEICRSLKPGPWISNNAQHISRRWERPRRTGGEAIRRGAIGAQPSLSPHAGKELNAIGVRAF